MVRLGHMTSCRACSILISQYYAHFGLVELIFQSIVVVGPERMKHPRASTAFAGAEPMARFV